MPIRRSLTFILTILNQLGKIEIRLENEVYCMRISKSEVIATASKIADENGLHNVSLKIVAERLKIKTPSLYNHIENLDDLLREVAHQGMRTMNERMEKIAIGKSGKTAIKAVSIEYLNFRIEHPGVYETIQWATWNGSETTMQIFGNYLSLLKTLILSCGTEDEQVEDILNILTGVIHGYTTLQLRYAFDNPEEVQTNLAKALDVVLLGVSQTFKWECK